MTSNAPAAPSARFTGLDGLRAIAVGLVVVYHLFPPALAPGGFVGVDVFFVLSGFLITSLLLREHDATGRIRLGEFWKRRARRLLPAMALVVTVCSTAAWLIDGDVLVRLGDQVIGALTFSYNWVSVAGGGGYFAASSPELFRNFWSLAVEEQFYVVWPLVLPLFLLLPRVAARALAALALAAASAAWMLAVVSAGGDPTRAYFGTDTHSFGIVLGVALAFVLGPALARRHAAAATVPPLPAVVLPPGWTLALPPRTGDSSLSPSRHRTIRLVTGVAGGAALLGIGMLAWVPPADGAATFPGALLAVSLLTTAAIAAAVWPGSSFGPAIDVPPMKWIGDRSYGIYLWHWPLLVLAMAAVPARSVPLWTGVGVLTLTLVIAELSYRFVETPVRRYGFRASARLLAAQFRRGPRRRLRALGWVLVGAVMLGGTSAAIAAAPAESSGQTAVEAGRAALERSRAHTPSSTSAPQATPTGTPRPADPPPTADPAVPSASGGAGPSPTPSPTAVAGSEVTAVGDSVMLASAPALLDGLPGIAIDAEVSRSMWAAPGILEALDARGALRPYVVVALGTNGAVDSSSLERMAEIVGPDRHLILVNAHAPRDWIPGVNHDLAAFAQRHRAVVLADWDAAIAPRSDLLAGDEIHPGAAGGRVFARTVDEAIQAIETERAQVEYRRELRQYLALHDRRLPQPQ